jgi:hypothetical protein
MSRNVKKVYVAPMSQISIKTPNPTCRLYSCLIEFIDWRYSQSCWSFRPLLWTSTSLTFSLVHLPPLPLFPVWISTGVYIRGLQCFKLNGNHTGNDRYWQKNNFLRFAKCLKMYSFFRICILRLRKVLLWPKFFFFNINMGIKNAEFYADFKFVDADLNKCPF